MSRTIAPLVNVVGRGWVNGFSSLIDPVLWQSPFARSVIVAESVWK